MRKVLEYVSPSSLETWEQCQWKTYLTRLSPDRNLIKRELQSLPSAVGSAFDAFCKHAINPDLDLNILLKSQVEKHFDLAIDYGQMLFSIYQQCGALSKAIEDGLEKVGIDLTEKIGGAIVHGRIDGVTNQNLPLDWKVRGFASSPKSPTPGYVRIWKNGILLPKVHDKYQAYFETINPTWATQLTTYAFLLGHTIGEPLTIMIDELSMRQNTNTPIISPKTVVVSQIRSQVSMGFQWKLYDRYQKAWNSFSKQEFKEAQPSTGICFKYAKTCEAAVICNKFQDGNFGDKDFMELCN